LVVDRILYRKCVIVTILLVATQAVLWSFFSSFLPETLKLADETFQSSQIEQAPPALMLFKLCVLVVSLIGAIAGLIGLYFYKRWALLLNTALFFATPLTHYCLDYNLTAWPTAALSDILSSIFGGLMALAWFTSIREEFM
jgi:hypothetical protein